MSYAQVLRGATYRLILGPGIQFIRALNDGVRAAYFGRLSIHFNNISDVEWTLFGSTVHPIRFIDMVRERPKKEIQSLGISRAGQTTKFHLAFSPRGVISWHLGPGNESDSVALQKLWAFWDWSHIFAVIADRGYDSKKIRAVIRACGAIPVIPFRSHVKNPESIDITLYKTRGRIECRFGYSKENKRLYSRFDKLDFTFAAFHALALIKSHLAKLPAQILC